MPITTEVITSRSGHPVLRAVFSGTVTVEEARAYHSSLLSGAPYDHYGHLVVGNVTGISKEVREVLSSAKADPRNPIPVALVIESPLMRMMANLVQRVGTNENTEFFKEESKGLDWLDGALTRYHAKRAAEPQKTASR